MKRNNATYVTNQIANCINSVKTNSSNIEFCALTVGVLLLYVYLFFFLKIFFQTSYIQIVISRSER